MLTLANPFRIGAQTVYRDVAYKDGQRLLTTKFYAMPDAPRLARDDSGGPAFRFLWYRSLGQTAANDPKATAGGMLAVTVTLAPDPAGWPELREAIAAAANVGPGDAVEKLALSFTSGAPTLSSVAQNGDLEF